MKLNKDIFKMTSRISLLLCGAVAFASAEDSTLVERQTSLLNTLDSMNSAVMGLRVGGTAKAGVLSSTMSSDQLRDGTDYRENQAYTDVNFVVTARPSEETQARVELRLHKDWQSAFEESINPVIGHWFSYDGKILNKHVDFNLGYMRVGYTPFTLYVPQTEILQEPEIFASKRREALAMRNLDTSSNRLMQGLNVEYNSFEIGPVDNISVQMTGARLRNSAKKFDEVFFDFDYSDRYLFGSNALVDVFGVNLGGNFIYTFDRVKSARANSNGLLNSEVFYEDNLVYSGIAGFDSKKLIMDGKIRAGINAEFAGSRWIYSKDLYSYVDTVHAYVTYGEAVPQYDELGYKRAGSEAAKSAGGSAKDIYVNDTLFYLLDSVSIKANWEKEKLEDLKGTAFSVTPFVEGEIENVVFKLKGLYLQTDKDFWSEQASSNYYVGGLSILNGDAKLDSANQLVVERFRAGSLENLYFAIYNTNVLEQSNLMSQSPDNKMLDENRKDSPYTFARLSNNYKLGHFYKNAYRANASKRMELETEFVDPSVNMALPMGLATPDRKGFAANVDLAWNDAISLNFRFSSFNQDEIDNKYTTLGFGAGVDVAPFLGLDRRMILQGSYESGKENAYLKRETSRIVAGATLDVWGPFSILGGLQMLSKDYKEGLFLDETATVVVNGMDETLALGGLQIKLGAGAVFDFQAGVLKNSVDYTVNGTDPVTSAPVSESKKLDVDKFLLMGNVTVLF